MTQKYAYTMHRVNKIVPPGKHILKDISLSYFYGAKIGVLGLNGAGKSTFLRIMAGEEKNFTGDAQMQPGLSVGFLPQEPKLDEKKTVKENVQEGLGETAQLLKEFEDVSAKLGDPDITPEAMEKLIERQGVLQEKIDAV